MPLGIPELLVILVIVLLVFGPKRLPMLGRQLGGGLREFKDSITARGDGAREAAEDERAAAELAASPAESDTDAFGRPSAPVREEPAGGGDEAATRDAS